MLPGNSDAYSVFQIAITLFKKFWVICRKAHCVGPGPSRETAAWSQMSSKLEGSSDEPPAEPCEMEGPVARPQWWPSPKQTSWSNRRASTNSCSRPDAGSSGRRAPKQTGCRNRRRPTQKRCGKRSEDTHGDHHSCGHIWA